MEGIGLGFVYRFLKDIGGAGLRWWKGAPPQERLAIRQKWKPRFEEYLLDRNSKDLRSDTIIRDVKRMDQYPDLDEKAKGISPWFRVGLAGTYHRGIYVGFQWHDLVDLGNGKYRVLDILNHDKDDEELRRAAIRVVELGSIPFENIEDVDFDGDEYYGYPHIYCHFVIKKQPYEKIALYTQNRLFPDSLPYYTEIADSESVRKESIKAGIAKPWI